MKILKSIIFCFSAVLCNQLVAKDYNASLFGIRSDGATLNTRSIQKAIDHIHDKGGGRLVFSVGRYLTGTVYLKSNVTLHLKEDAVLLGSTFMVCSLTWAPCWAFGFGAAGLETGSAVKQRVQTKRADRSRLCLMPVQCMCNPCLHRLCGFLGGPVACLPCLMAPVNHVGVAGRSGALNLLICLDKERPCSINFRGNLDPPHVAEMRPSQRPFLHVLS